MKPKMVTNIASPENTSRAAAKKKSGSKAMAEIGFRNHVTDERFISKSK